MLIVPRPIFGTSDGGHCFALFPSQNLQRKFEENRDKSGRLQALFTSTRRTSIRRTRAVQEMFLTSNKRELDPEWVDRLLFRNVTSTIKTFHHRPTYARVQSIIYDSSARQSQHWQTTKSSSMLILVLVRTWVLENYSLNSCTPFNLRRYDERSRDYQSCCCRDIFLTFSFFGRFLK